MTGRTLQVLLWGALILACCGATGPIFNRLVLGTHNSASAVPPVPPLERNRVLHPAGFSIVRPEGWHSQVYPQPANTIVLRSSNVPWRTVSGAIVVRMFADRPETLPEDQRTSFQGQTAYVEIGRKRADTWEDFPRFTYRLILSRNHRWYDIEYVLHKDVAMLPDEARAYIASFRVGDGS